MAIAAHFGEIAHPAQQAIGDTRRAARTLGDFLRAVIVDTHFQQLCRARDDQFQFCRRIKFQARDDTETVT